MFIESLKRLYWDFSNKNGRQLLLEHLYRNIPGNFGMYLRRVLYKKLFISAGDNMNILTGTYLIHPERIKCGQHFKVGICNYLQAGGGLIFGDHVLLGPYVKIWTQNHRTSDPNIPIHQQGYEYKEVIIGNDVWIGANSFIMPGSIIGDGCIVSAGSVVGAKQYPDGIILAGNPARKIGQRF